VSQNEEEFLSAEELVAKYGTQKIIHKTWPDNFMNEQQQMKRIIGQIGLDQDVKALIVNQMVPGTVDAVDQLLALRSDIFLVGAIPQDDLAEVAARFDLVVLPDELAMGAAMVEQAQKLGAKVFVHYSFARHMDEPLLAERRDLIEQKCAELGLTFVDATAPDPTSEVGIAGAQQFIREDVPRLVAQYGKDTAFFATNCAMQAPLIQAVVETGAIYPQPCCPSPYHGFPLALGIISHEGEDMGSVDYVLAETTRRLAEKGMLGRLSTWPVSSTIMNTVGLTEYAIRWINGEVPQDKGAIDRDAFYACLKDYAQTDFDLSAYAAADGQFDNIFLEMMPYYTYK